MPQLLLRSSNISSNEKLDNNKRKRDKYMKQTDRQTNRQTDRQTDRQTNKQTDRQTDKQTDKYLIILIL